MRILLKLSGEMIGDEHSPFLNKKLERVITGLKKITDQGHELAIVIGGGNIWRYRDHKALPLERIPSDFLGMLATLYNANCLKATLDTHQIPVKIFSKTICPAELAEKYSKTAAKKSMQKGEIVILAGGTGQSGYSTDTGAAMLATDIDADIIWKATKVDGVYDKDPMQYKTAKQIPELSYKDYLKKNLGVMDLSAIEICQKNNIPVRVFKFCLTRIGKLAKGKPVGSIIK